MEQTLNKSQHTKLTLEKKILQPLLLGFKLTTFRSQVWRSNQQAIPAPQPLFYYTTVHIVSKWTIKAMLFCGVIYLRFTCMKQGTDREQNVSMMHLQTLQNPGILTWFSCWLSKVWWHSCWLQVFLLTVILILTQNKARGH